MLAVVHGLRAAGKPIGPTPGSVPITRGQAPELWRTVTELAERVGTAPPSRIRLTMDTNAAVVDESPFGSRPGARRMYIGLPLLAGLEADQLRAVLAHELAHYARGHTWIAAMTHRGSVLLHNARRDRIEPFARIGSLTISLGGPRLVLSLYSRWYDLLSLAIRRRQEFEADAIAARIVGPEALAEALASIPEIALAWRDFQDRFLTPMCAAGRAPDDLLRAFAEMLADPEYRSHLESRSADSPEPTRSRHDSHPPLRDRLAALAEIRSESARGGRDPARALLNAAGTLPSTTWPALARLRTQRAQISRPWRAWLREATRLETTRALGELATPVGLIATARPRSRPAVSSADFLELLEAGRGRELSAALRATTWGHRRWGLAENDQLPVALGSLVGHDLVTAGRGTWQVNWVGPGRFHPADADAGAAYALVGPAVSDPEAAHQLRTRLDVCRVDVTQPAATPSGTGTDRRNGRTTTVRRAADESTTSVHRTRSAPILVGVVLLSVLTWTFVRISDTSPEPDPPVPVSPYARHTAGIEPSPPSTLVPPAGPTALPSRRFTVDDVKPPPPFTLRPDEWLRRRTGSPEGQ
ncbi:M48 family metallopeptidase [Embleya sp. AB8]|uniref:M48 family metallopeptidase n=1 Tax=Embleya sp. AB8 TaxID=3156304 RepID=UPI003C732CEF